MMFRLLWNVSRRELATRPVRVGLFVVAVAVGVAMITAMRLATDGIVAGYNAELERIAGRADLQITFGTGEAGFPEDILLEVQAQPYVAHAAAVVRGVLTFADESGETLELFGIDVLQNDVLDIYDVTVLERTKDDFTIINDPYGVFLTREVAAERGVALGDKVSFSSVLGTHEYTIHGILEPRGLAEVYGGRLAAMFLPAAQPVAGKSAGYYESNVDQIDVVLGPGVDVTVARSQLRSILPDELMVAEPLQRQLATRKTVAGLRGALLGISTLALLAATFILYATTATLVGYRTPGLATLITIGADRKSLVRLILCEAGILGLTGSVIGVILGTGLSTFVAKDVAVGMSLNYSLDLANALPEFDLFALAIVYPLCGSLAAIVAAYGPARRLRQLDVIALKAAWAQTTGVSRLSGLTMVAVAAATIAAGAGAVALGVSVQSSSWCTAGGICLIVGGIIVAVPLVRQAWASVQLPLARRFGIVGRIAGENLNRTAGRGIVTVAAIALCISVAVAAATLAFSFRKSVFHWYGFKGDALVASRVIKGGWLSAPIAGDLEDSIVQLPSVAQVETLRVSQGQVYGGERVAVVALSDGFVADAVGLASARRGGDTPDVVRRIKNGEAVAVSDNFATHFGVELAQDLSVPSPTGTVSLPIAAIVPDYVSDKGSILMSRQVFRERWRDGLVNYIAVDLRDGATVASLRRDIGRELQGATGLSVLETAEMVRQVEGMIDKAFADVDTIQLLVILITLAGIVDLLVSNVLDRRRELALLRLVGTTNRSVVRSVVIEAAIIGITAGMLGALVGAASSWVWLRFNYPVLVGYVLEFHFSWASAVVCVTLSTATAAITGAVATMGTLRGPVVEAMHFE